MSVVYDRIIDLFSKKSPQIEAWFQEAYARVPTQFYTSVDIRHSGFKLAPVDTNLFPAGFNLLSVPARERAVFQTKHYFNAYYPKAKNVLLIPENHTRNLHYLENVAVLKAILEESGKTVHLGGLQGEGILHSSTGKELVIEPLTRQKELLATRAGFIADLIVMNNDLTSGVPDILKDIAQPVIPPLGLGWHRRRKTTHFETYDEVVQRFSTEFGLDPWLISTSFMRCRNINFKEQTGIDCVVLAVEKVLHHVQLKYKEYNINNEPYVFVKSDTGTYGMGIMVVRSPHELLEMNKKIRNKMNVIKEGTINTEVMIQEGVPTIDSVDGKVAESLVYLMNGEAVGCMYRINERRDAYGNLNSEGVSFQNACEEDKFTPEDPSRSPCPVLSLIGKLATLAATQECYEPKWDI